MILWDYRVIILEGLLNTVVLAAVVWIASTVCAVVMAAGMLHRWKIVSLPTSLIVEIVRDIPLLVTLFLTYFMLPRLGLTFDAFWSTAAAISIWGGANGAQIIRAGMVSVSKAQRETAAAFGLRSWKGLSLVTLPQAMPVILPPYVSLVADLTQATSLGAVIGVHELLRSAKILIEQSTITQGGSPAFVVYGFILVVYFVMCWVISRSGLALERRVLRPYRKEAVPSGARRPSSLTQNSASFAVTSAGSNRARPGVQSTTPPLGN